jgi:hypothetical protein
MNLLTYSKFYFLDFVIPVVILSAVKTTHKIITASIISDSKNVAMGGAEFLEKSSQRIDVP